MKRGFLLAEETVKIVLAVIGLLFLAYLLFSLYYNHLKNEKLEEAKSTLDRMKTEMGNINVGEKIDFIIYNPSPTYPGGIGSWHVSSGNINTPGCFSTNCLCICDNSKCDGKNACQETSKPVTSSLKISQIPLTIKIENKPTFFEITK